VGSWDLQALFSRHSASQVPLANDMSVSVGYAPLRALERLVLAMKSTSMEETVTVNTLHGVRTSRLWGFGTEAECTLQWHVQ
jgi:S-adenosylmethionine synthetase